MYCPGRELGEAPAAPQLRLILSLSCCCSACSVAQALSEAPRVHQRQMALLDQQTRRNAQKSHGLCTVLQAPAMPRQQLPWSLVLRTETACMQLPCGVCALPARAPQWAL